MRRISFVVTLICLSLPPLRSSGALPYDALYAFGDSLTDTGREPPPNEIFWYMGRYSNGPLWVDYLSQRLGLAYDAANNYARSGAQTDDTLGQITSFFPSGSIAGSLCVVWAGGNDFLQTYDSNGTNDALWNPQITNSVNHLSNAVVALYAKGARSVLVPNLVDMSEVPPVNKAPSEYRDYIRSKAQLFNSLLAQALGRLTLDLPDLHLFDVEVFGKFAALLQNAAAFGFTHTEEGALQDFDLFDKRFDGPGRNYVFWDIFHPTTKSHEIIADWFQAEAAPLNPRLNVTLSGTRLDLALTHLHWSKTYSLRRSEDLVSWLEARTFSTVATNLVISATNDSPAAFYSVVLPVQ